MQSAIIDRESSMLPLIPLPLTPWIGLKFIQASRHLNTRNGTLGSARKYILCDVPRTGARSLEAAAFDTLRVPIKVPMLIVATGINIRPTFALKYLFRKCYWFVIDFIRVAPTRSGLRANIY